MAATNIRAKLLSQVEQEQMIAAGTQIEALQPFVPKIYSFDSFAHDGNKITGCVSKNEMLTLSEPLELTANADWIEAVTNAIKITLKKLLLLAVSARDIQDRFTWLQNFPYQIWQLVERVRFTSKVIKTLDSQEPLSEFLKELKEENEALIVWLRGDHALGAKTSAKSLLTYGIHYVRVVERLISESVFATTDFMWRSQLQASYDSINEHATLMIGSKVQDYQYNYVGNDGVLAITEQTEKIYSCMFEALDEGLGFAALGPPGTGKAETVQQLAKELGRDCIVCNCSEKLTPDIITALFDVAENGNFWMVFDQFNTIKAEHLDEIGQFIGNKRAPWFLTIFPGREGRLDLSSQIVDKVKAISTYVPDLKIIYEIMFSIEGFKYGRSLGSKLTYFYYRAKDMFSKQPHYDHGLRSGRFVVTQSGAALGQIAQAGVQINTDIENTILFTILSQVMRQTLKTRDLAQFERFTKEMFYGRQAAAVSNPELEAALADALTDMGLKVAPRQLDRAVNMVEVMRNRHSVALFGADGVGKRTIVDSTILALEKTGNPVTKHDIDATDCNVERLLGVDGPIVIALQSCNNSDASNWIVIKNDGECGKFMDRLNSLTDDNKKLELEDETVIPLPSNTHILFLLKDAWPLSPATVSRLGKIWINEEDADFKLIHN